MSQPGGLAILYAEDDPDDRLLAEMAHRDSRVASPLVFVADGDETMEYLRRAGRHADPTGWLEPGMVLLDLNMPGTDGLDTLRAVRADHALRRIPVVILTTSTAQADIAACYEAGASSYIIKPSAFGDLVRLFSRVCDYWFDLSSSPQAVGR
jgi:two-component system response regulator